MKENMEEGGGEVQNGANTSHHMKYKLQLRVLVFGSDFV